jgi:hypothetical protein
MLGSKVLVYVHAGIEA